MKTDETIAATRPITDQKEIEQRVLSTLLGVIEETLARNKEGAPDNGMSSRKAPPDTAPVTPPALTSAANTAAPPLSRDEMERLVIDTFEELTRYPREILIPAADIEEELGIDSVKSMEILAALRTRLDVPTDFEIEPMEPRTIADVIELSLSLVERLAQWQSSNGKTAPAISVDADTAPALSVSAKSEPAITVSTPITDRESATGNGRGYGPLNIAPTTFGVFSPNDRPFAGKVALVTGSGHGIGEVIACQLAELGARVIINSFYSRSRGDETTARINAAGGDAIHLWGSVANSKQLTKIFEEIEERYGYLDLFVQNASNGVIAPLNEVTEEHWEKGFRTNVVGYHQGAMLAAELMKKRGGGRIVALSSPGAQRYLEYFGCLGPVKAAVESLTLYLAIELAPYNIQVNAVSAGPVYGERLTNYPESERLIPYWETLSADHRLGDSQDISNTVIYLLSDAAKKINGSVLLVDGAASQRM